VRKLPLNGSRWNGRVDQLLIDKNKKTLSLDHGILLRRRTVTRPGKAVKQPKKILFADKLDEAE